jgi:hypothetical protein
MTWHEPSLEHLIALSDDVGIFQHATHDVPNRREGYCTDDVARAFMVANLATRAGNRRDQALRLGRIYLSFLHDAQRPDGRFRNFMSHARAWLDPVGTPDSNGRAIWAAGHGLRFAPREGWRQICGSMLDLALPNVSDLKFLRSLAYAALGLAHAYEARLGKERSALAAALRAIGADFTARHAAVASPEWDWFENELTYDNARIPEALLRIGTVLEDSALIDLGVRSLVFYESIVVENAMFVPVGNAGWYVRGGERARYAQQPLEAAAFIDAALAAEAATSDRHYRKLAESTLDWFYGRNSCGALLATPDGGCCDGLERLTVNRNMGAESTLAFVASAFALGAPAEGRLRLARSIP